MKEGRVGSISMISEQHKSKPAALSNELINLQDHYLNNIMDVGRTKNPRRSIPYQGHHSKRRMFRYFTLESLFLLACLTVSLLVLPLVLPPLPPPPFMLLLLPIFILALLMLLAFMPSGLRELTHA